MALGQPIQLSLSPGKQLHYEAEAANQNLPLATYLRERLENADTFLDEISALRRSISHAKNNASDISRSTS